MPTEEQAPAPNSTPATTPEVKPATAAPASTPVELPPAATAALRTLLERERAAQQAEQRLKAREAELREAEALRYQLTQRPDVAKQLSQPLDANAALMAKIQELEARDSAREQREEQFRREAAVREAQLGVRTWVKEAPEDKFPLLRSYAKGPDMVWSRIESHYQKTGELLSEAEAARDAEAELSGLVEQLAKVEAVRKRFLPPDPTKETPTISGLQVADGSQSRDLESLSDDEAMAHAIAILAASKG